MAAAVPSSVGATRSAASALIPTPAICAKDLGPARLGVIRPFEDHHCRSFGEHEAFAMTIKRSACVRRHDRNCLPRLSGSRRSGRFPFHRTTAASMTPLRSSHTAVAIAWLDDAHAEETVNTGPRMPYVMLI